MIKRSAAVTYKPVEELMSNLFLTEDLEDDFDLRLGAIRPPFLGF